MSPEFGVQPLTDFKLNEDSIVESNDLLGKHLVFYITCFLISNAINSKEFSVTIRKFQTVNLFLKENLIVKRYKESKVESLTTII